MKITITFEMNNLAFSGGNSREVVNVLSKLSQKASMWDNIDSEFSHNFMDTLGNQIGSVIVESDSIVKITLIGPDGDEVMVTFGDANRKCPKELLVNVMSDVVQRHQNCSWRYDSERNLLVCGDPMMCFLMLRGENYKAKDEEEHWLKFGYFPS